MTRPQRKRGRLRRALLYGLVCVSVFGIGYSLYRLYGLQAEYAAEDALYTGLRLQAHTNEDASVGTSGAPTAATPAPQEGQTPEATPSPAPESLMDFDALRQINPDTVAWITLENSVIDYPVVQAEDDVYYLHHLYSGKRGASGAIFMEAENAADFSDKNTVLFGHHMKNGSMFASLDKYRKQAYFDEHRTATLYTPYGDHVVEWFAGYVADAAPIPLVFEGDEAFMAFLAEAYARSTFESGVTVLPADRVVTLSTCTYVFHNARYVLLGVVR